MTERAFAFYSSCPTIWHATFDSEQTGWLDFLFFSTSQRFRRTSTFDDTLVFNECIMEWVNIPRTGLGGSKSIAWAGRGQKIPFPLFCVCGQLNCAISGYQKWLAGFEIDQHKDFHA
jgi:hypothetical protein